MTFIAEDLAGHDEQRCEPPSGDRFTASEAPSKDRRAAGSDHLSRAGRDRCDPCLLRQRWLGRACTRPQVHRRCHRDSVPPAHRVRAGRDGERSQRAPAAPHHCDRRSSLGPASISSTRVCLGSMFRKSAASALGQLRNRAGHLHAGRGPLFFLQFA
jgi:hypothetical protein